MIEEDYPVDQLAPGDLTPMYNYSQIVIEDEKDIFTYFLRKLNFEMPSQFNSYELTNEEISILKENIDRIYQAHTQRRLTLRNIEGLWPLLAFLFRNINGMLLYLQFERLLESYQETQEKNDDHNIKQEYPDFNPKKYFQHNNLWKENTKFMKKARVLERNIKEFTHAEAKQDCLRIFKIVLVEQIDYQQVIHNFNQKYSQFKKEVLEKSKDSKMRKGALRTNHFFSTRLVDQGFVASEPDNFQSINEIFTKEQYLTIYQKGNNLINGPFQKCKSVIEEVPESEEESKQIEPRPMEVEDDSVLISTISLPNKKQRTTVYTKSPNSSKKKRLIFGEERPVRRANPQMKRLPRRKFIERLFSMTEDKNLLLKQLKMDREKQRQMKKKTDKLEKIKRKIAYISDEEDEEIKTHTRKKKLSKIRRMEIQSDPQSKLSHLSLGRPQQYSVEEMEEESIFEDRTRKNKIARKHTPIKNNKIIHHSMRIFDEDLISDEEDSPEDRTFIKRKEVQVVLINKKEDKSLNYLKKNLKDPKNRAQNGRIQRMQNIQLRKIELQQQRNLFMTIDMQTYIDYLCDLQDEKQIKREVMNVSKEMLDRSQRQADIDLTLKIIALNTMETVSNTYKLKWKEYKEKYLFPMLKYQIITNTFRAVTQVFNNLFESPQEEDLTFLHKFKQFVKIIYIRCSKWPDLKLNITTIIYECLVTPRRLTVWKKHSFDLGSAFIVLDSPYMTGPRHSKYKLQSDTQNALALILSSFIFDQLFMVNLPHDAIEAKKSEYLDTLSKQLEDGSMKQKLRGCIFKFTHLFHQYHVLYLPATTDNYFFKVLNIVYISVHIMKEYLVNKQNYPLIQQHVEFIKLIFKQYIDTKLIEQPQKGNRNLFNYLTIQNKFNHNFGAPKMAGKTNIHVIIFSEIYSFLLSYNYFKQTFFEVQFFKYLNEKLKDEMDDIINKMDLYTLNSIFNLLSILYRMKIGDKIQQENEGFCMEKMGKPLRLVEKDSTKYDNLRQLIVALFNKIDERYDQSNSVLEAKQKERVQLNRRDKKQPAKAQQIENSINVAKQRMLNCCQVIASFLNTFILNSQNRYRINQQPDSISHFFFSLSFIIEHNYFFKYLTNKILPACNCSFLPNKCAEILHHFFVEIPDFVPFLFPKKQDNPNNSEDSDIDFAAIQASKRERQKHDKYFKLYYQLIHQHPNKPLTNLSKSKKEEQLFFMASLDYLEAFTSVYSSQIVSKFQTREGIANIQNMMMRFISDSFILQHSPAARIEKVVYFMKYLFKYLNNYITSVKHRGNVQQNTLKSDIREHFIIKWQREILLTVFLGLCLKNNSNYFNLPIQDMIQQIKKSRLIEANHQPRFSKSTAYTYFLVSLQKCNNIKNMSNIFSEFCNNFSAIRVQSEERKALDSSLYDLLSELQAILRKIQMSSCEKWHEALQSIRVIIFLLDWKTIKVECIKSYLNEMQVISKAQSLISKTKITESNLVLLLTFFKKIKDSSMNPYQIKDTMYIFIDSMCRTLQIKEQQQHNYVPKEQFKVFVILRECLKKNREIQGIGMQFLQGLNSKLWMRYFNEQDTKKHDIIFTKLLKFLQLMKDSYWQRSVYQKFVNNNRQIFQNLIKTHFSMKPYKFPGSNDQISSFEEMVYVCMIGQHSDFFEIKALVRFLLNKNSQSPSKMSIMKQILEKFTIFNKQGNIKLNDWAKQETQRLEYWNGRNRVIRQMIQMDIQ